MLSNKLKHMCSRVIASLSAMGLISIANSSDAAATTATPGATVKYDFSADKTFTANYASNGPICVNDATSGYASIVAQSGGCFFTCASGYGVVTKGNPSASGCWTKEMPGSNAFGTWTGQTCPRVTYKTGDLIPSHGLVSGGITTSRIAASGIYGCTKMVDQYYASFACHTGGSPMAYGENMKFTGSAYTGAVLVNKGASIVMPPANACSMYGYTLSGWSY